MTSRLTRTLAPLALAALLPRTTLAEPAAACPADAERALYGMECPDEFFSAVQSLQAQYVLNLGTGALCCEEQGDPDQLF